MTDDSLVIGVDLGTSYAKAAAYNTVGELIASAECPCPTAYQGQGMVEQNPHDWISAVKHVLRSIAHSLPGRTHQIKAVGLSAHAPAVVPTDAEGLPLMTGIPIWNDLRCVPNGQILVNQVGEAHIWTGPGIVLAAHYPKLHWLVMNHANVVQQARWLLSPKDLIGLWLTGNAKSDPSSGSGAEHWRQDLLDICGVDESRLPEVVKPTDLTGYLQKQTASELDLPPGIPIVTGLPDGAAASISAKALHPGDVIFTLGTNGVVRIVTTAPASGKSRLASGVFCWSYIDGLWIIGGHTRIGAGVLTWLINLIGDANTSIDDIIQLAASAPVGSDGLIFLPYLLGRGSPYNDDKPLSALYGLSLSSNRKTISRAVLEGMAFALHDVLQALTHNPERIHITGGGAKSAIWTQIIADVVNKPVMVYNTQSALGAAIVAAVGVGIYPTVAAAADRMAHMNWRQTPIHENHLIYLHLQQRFQSLLNKLL